MRTRWQPIVTRPPVAAVRWAPLLVMAGAATLVLLLTAGRYGYDGDEFYFIAAGEHLSWSYADQSVLVPLLAHLLDTAFPGSLLALRTPSALLVGLGVLVTGLISRELGGRGRAQLLAGGAHAMSPFVLWSGHLLATVPIDIFLWTLTTYLVVRWVRVRDDRLLLLAGLCTAVALQVKYLIPVFWLMLGLCALLTGQRDLLRRPLLWAGAGIAVLAVVPALGWQAAHGWPHLGMATAVGAEQDAFQGGRVGFAFWLILYAGSIGILLAGCGIPWLLRRSPYRFLGWTVLAVLALVFLINGRPYYVVGLFPLVFAAGAVFLQDRAPARWQRIAGVWFSGIAAVITVVLVLPVLPVEIVHRYPALVPNPLLRSEVGWPKLVDEVDRAYRSLSPAERSDSVIIADVYPHAAALEFYAPTRGLPDVYSGHRGYWYFGAPPDSAGTAIVVGGDEQFLRRRFSEVRKAGRVGGGALLENVVLRRPTVWICTGTRQPWSESWPQWLHMNVDTQQ